MAGFADAPRHVRALFALANEIAREAGNLHERGVENVLHIQTKSSPTDLVSQIDHEAEKLIVERITAARPDDSILAEEGALVDGTNGVRWIIDPLDGTTNYVYGYPSYCVSIAVEVEGRPQIGVVYDSSAGHLYRAISGFGAMRDHQRLEVRRQPDLAQALVATGFSYRAERRERQGRAAAHVISRVRDIRRGGSAALDLCHVAAGHVDAFWELYLNPWDFAAGSIIAREAGAEMFFREAADGPLVVAANAALLPPLLELLKEAGVMPREGAGPR
jgi:myo-inositol-1(or 4)-monophosphatase